MPYSIAVVGMGYVGLVTAVGLADFSNTVIGVDIDEAKINELNSGRPTIFEHGLEDYLRRNLEAGRLQFTCDLGSAVRQSDLVFIAVGTPTLPSGDTDLTQIDRVIEVIGNNLNNYKVIIIKSTVPIGTNRNIQKQLQQLCGHDNFGELSNPEFLREGHAINDFFHPDRVVVEFTEENARRYAEIIYRPLYLIQTPFVWCSFETAELIKLASNAYLALKISFINQIANLCEVAGADVQAVARAMGMDGRIGYKFLHAGPGFGGGCFPKDIRALTHLGEKLGVNMSLVKEISSVNERQKNRPIEKLEKLIELKGKTITVLGLAFKNETDDIRESPALAVVGKLLGEGAMVQAHDPRAMANFSKAFPDLEYHSNLYDAARNADAVVILTDWNEYRNIDLLRLKSAMRGNIILDTRNLLDPQTAMEFGFHYQGTGRHS